MLPLGWLWYGSLLPDEYDMAQMGHADWGGGPRGVHAAMAGGHHGTAVSELIADPERTPDVRETLTVRDDGRQITVNGSTPGPTIRAHQGDLVEVTLVNDNLDDGTTLHWHGVDVPNAVDGVAGVTQDAVMPGEEHVYRFVAEDAGSYWYHSHQVSHEQVQRGLLGALVVEPTEDGESTDVDETFLIHRYGGSGSLNGVEGFSEVDAEPGDTVRLRLVNTDNGLATVWLPGATFRVLAVDGTDVNQPGELTDTAIPLPAGGRVDIGFTVPDDGVRVEFSGGPSLGIAAGPADARTSPPDEVLDLLTYGEPEPAPFDVEHPDRRFEYAIDRKPGFLDGRPGMWWTVNGGIFPDVPMYMVSEGDVVVFEITNDSGDAHPMHLHGHHALVLSRDGVPATGSPWWVDSLEVAVGERYEVAVLADNPGVWMDHCHNLPHAAEGLVAHLMYDGVSSSYVVGGEHGNHPE
ncbi:multicopper oxidase family protein [Nocardioides sp.]|uniref:multicopper oxidase family protein n=1 Tax=Nocardioides sp. TaxID=35761 RepID=UPI002ED666B7